MASPRRRLLDAAAECLTRIRVADGYATDLGATLKIEPGAIDPDAAESVLTVFVERQARSPEPSKALTHRLTTLTVLAKHKTEQGGAEALVDDAVSDIEKAMAEQQGRFATGFEFPKYQGMEPLRGGPGTGWVGVFIRYTSHIPIR